MYTLRTIYREKDGWNPPGVITNTLLGTSYTVIKQELSTPLFNEQLKANGWQREKEIYALVRDPEGNLNPLYNDCDHFIMTESGKTFERI